MGFSKLHVLCILAATLAAVLYQSRLHSDLQSIEPGSAIVITGASSGIGKHAALTLLKEGFTVFACVRKPMDGEALLATAKTFGLDASPLRPILLDVTNEIHIQQAVETINDFVGDKGLHGLFNNAGILLDPSTGSSAIEYQNESIYRQTFDVNFFGMIKVTQAFLPLLRKGQGRILMNSSIAGFFASPFLSAYSSSKWAMEGFSDSLRRELAPVGVSVSILQPYFITSSILKMQMPSDRTDPYSDAETHFWENFYKNSLVDAAPPRVASTAVVHAMRAKQPKIRYFVGATVAPVLRFIVRWLPDTLLDLAIRNQPKLGWSAEDKLKAMKAAQTEFEL